MRHCFGGQRVNCKRCVVAMLDGLAHHLRKRQMMNVYGHVLPQPPGHWNDSRALPYPHIQTWMDWRTGRGTIPCCQRWRFASHAVVRRPNRVDLPHRRCWYYDLSPGVYCPPRKHVQISDRRRYLAVRPASACPGSKMLGRVWATVARGRHVVAKFERVRWVKVDDALLRQPSGIVASCGNSQPSIDVNVHTSDTVLSCTIGQRQASATILGVILSQSHYRTLRSSISGLVLQTLFRAIYDIRYAGVLEGLSIKGRQK